MEDNNVVTKGELKNFQLITKMEDNIQALTDAKKEADKENDRLTEQNDILKKENAKITETNKALILELSDLKQEHQTIKQEYQRIKTETDEHMNNLVIELNSANEKISAHDEVILQKQNIEAELKAANDKLLEQSQLLTQKQSIETELKTATEKIATIEAEHNKDKELLSLLSKPVIRQEDLAKYGAVIDYWNGKAIILNLVFKKEFMKDSYLLDSLA